jgi:hypothetical protein
MDDQHRDQAVNRGLTLTIFASRGSSTTPFSYGSAA